jgi:hypothetical protein
VSESVPLSPVLRGEGRGEGPAREGLPLLDVVISLEAHFAPSYDLPMPSTAAIQIPPLTRQSMSDLVAKAKRLGIQPGDYAKKLIEEGLAFQREAEGSSFAEIMRPVREAAGSVDDVEITELVETARAKHHSSTRRKKR